jgi:hypothetical protein
MSAFDTVSRDVLAEFLRTAVVIDDAAYMPQGDGKEKPPEAKLPGRVRVKRDAEPEPPARLSSHSLNTQLLVDSFACKGLVCAVIAPQMGEERKERLVQVAEHCDIVVIDWQMFYDDGELTCALIKDLFERDKVAGERLRMVCVYSGDSVGVISGKLQDRIGLTSVGGDESLLSVGNVIVTILTKSAVPEDNVPERLIDRFSLFTKGLLSNTVLAALAGIRRNVHRVVGKFDPGLDPAYISHRILSVPVETVEGEILSLIAAELESVIHQSTANLHINSDAVEKWLESDAGAGIKYDTLPGSNAEGPSLLKELAKYGADKTREGASAKFPALCNLVMNDKWIKESNVTTILAGGDGKKTDRRFAMLSTLETRYEKCVPQLTLGTIVHDGTQYLLCLLPRCDSTRVPVTGRNFLFIKLVESSSEVDLIVEDGRESVDLSISRHPYDTLIYRFVPDVDKKPVMARKDDETWQFYYTRADGSAGSVRWVTELKPQIAQAFANEYAAQVSRVGVKKSQWLHKLRKNKD